MDAVRFGFVLPLRMQPEGGHFVIRPATTASATVPFHSHTPLMGPLLPPSVGMPSFMWPER